MKITYSVLLKGSIEMCGPSVQFTLTRQGKAAIRHPVKALPAKIESLVERFTAVGCRTLTKLSVARPSSIVHVYIAQYGARIIRELPSEDASFVKKLLQPSELTFFNTYQHF